MDNSETGDVDSVAAVCDDNNRSKLILNLHKMSKERTWQLWRKLNDGKDVVLLADVGRLHQCVKWFKEDECADWDAEVTTTMFATAPGFFRRALGDYMRTCYSICDSTFIYRLHVLSHLVELGVLWPKEGMKDGKQYVGVTLNDDFMPNVFVQTAIITKDVFDKVSNGGGALQSQDGTILF